jgi:hypothetical protein
LFFVTAVDSGFVVDDQVEISESKEVLEAFNSYGEVSTLMGDFFECDDK